jgi:LmbE family N-acetylglucosaminyl deacetylase
MGPFPSERARRILVIAPHADDEVLGCGGTVAAAAARGAEVTLVVTAMGGIKHCHLETAAEAADRVAEMEAASRLLGIARTRVLFPGKDMRLESVPMLEMVTAMDEVLSEPCDECYFPEPSHNLDHRRTHEAVLAALRPCGRPSPGLVATYEGTVCGWPSPAGPGGRLYVDIAATLEAKVAALHEYRSQVRSYPHPTSEEAVRRLAAMRGLECGLNHAERFHIVQMVRR